MKSGSEKISEPLFSVKGELSPDGENERSGEAGRRDTRDTECECKAEGVSRGNVGCARVSGAEQQCDNESVRARSGAAQDNEKRAYVRI